MHENRGAAIAVAAVVFTGFATLGVLVAIFGWTGFSIYAIVTWVGSAPDEANPVTVVVLFAGVVVLIVTALLASLALVGRSMTPRKRDRERRQEQEIPGL